MKALSRSLLILAILGAGTAALILAYLEMRKERDLEATAETPVIAPSRVERASDQGPLLRLDSESQRRIGLQTAVPVAGSLGKEVTATARVLDGASLAAMLNEKRSSQAALEAARTDYDRKQKLFATGQNASASAVEQANAVLKQQELAVASTQIRITSTWGQALARLEDLQALVDGLLRSETALVRVDLLSSDRLQSQPATVRLLQANGEHVATAQVLGPSPATDLPIVGQSFLGLAATNASALLRGSTLLARIETGAKDEGMVIPRTAVVRHAGLGWVYTQTSTDAFTRRALPLDRPHPDGWLVSGAWEQPVVIAGAQSLLSEELKGSIQMRD